MRRLSRYIGKLLRSLGTGLATTALIVSGALVLNWGFLAFQLGRLGGATEARFTSLVGTVLSGSALVVLFGIVIPLIYLPVAKKFAVQMTARRLYNVHRDAVDRAVLDIVRRSSTLPGGGTRFHVNAAEVAAWLRGLPAPVAFVTRFALGRRNVDTFLGRLEAVHEAEPAPGAAATIALDAVHMQVDRLLQAGGGRMLKLMVGANLLLVVAAIVFS
jgi:hypothetical protein